MVADCAPISGRCSRFQGARRYPASRSSLARTSASACAKRLSSVAGLGTHDSRLRSRRGSATIRVTGGRIGRPYTLLREGKQQITPVMASTLASDQIFADSIYSSEIESLSGVTTFLKYSIGFHAR